MFPCRHELFRLSLCFNFSRRNGVIRRCIPDVTVKRRDLDMVWRTDGYSCYGCKNGIANTYSTYFVPLKLPRTRIFFYLFRICIVYPLRIFSKNIEEIFHSKISIVQLFLNRNNTILILLLSPITEKRENETISGCCTRVLTSSTSKEFRKARDIFIHMEEISISILAYIYMYTIRTTCPLESSWDEENSNKLANNKMDYTRWTTRTFLSGHLKKM